MGRFLGGVLGCAALLSVLSMAGAGDGDGKKTKKLDFEAFFKKLDANMDGKLNREEFLKLADRAKEKEKAREKLGQAFDKIDPRNQGITKEQFRRFLEQKKSDNK